MGLFSLNSQKAATFSWAFFRMDSLTAPTEFKTATKINVKNQLHTTYYVVQDAES